MTNSTTPTPIGVYFAWQKSLYRDEILRKHAGQGLRRKPTDIRSTAMYLSTFGTCGQHCHPSTETLAHDIGCDVRTIQRHLKLLVELGWFTAKRRKQDSTDYSICIPDKRHADVVPESTNDMQVSSSNDFQVSPDQEHITKNIEDQETVTTVTVNQEPVTTVTGDQEHSDQKHDMSPKSKPDVTQEKIKGPWCTGCDVPLVSNDQDHNEAYCRNCKKNTPNVIFVENVPCCLECTTPLGHEYVCTSCGTIDKIELSFSPKTAKAWYKCSSCNVFLVTKNNVLTAKVWGNDNG